MLWFLTKSHVGESFRHPIGALTDTGMYAPPQRHSRSFASAHASMRPVAGCGVPSIAPNPDRGFRMCSEWTLRARQDLSAQMPEVFGSRSSEPARVSGRVPDPESGCSRPVHAWLGFFPGSVRRSSGEQEPEARGGLLRGSRSQPRSRRIVASLVAVHRPGASQCCLTVSRSSTTFTGFET